MKLFRHHYPVYQPCPLKGRKMPGRTKPRKASTHHADSLDFMFYINTTAVKGPQGWQVMGRKVGGLEFHPQYFQYPLSLPLTSSLDDPKSGSGMLRAGRGPLNAPSAAGCGPHRKEPGRQHREKAEALHAFHPSKMDPLRPRSDSQVQSQDSALSTTGYDPTKKNK